ncbi:thiamine-phosphate kinase [Pelagicoccus sp. SDUM812002]|uniref:thiamine-phosphate kinase n=1 Tax=Pelagicoccus sp. SDUM812002 TaxID=3041266 RepID=UPI00280F6995|nr:thiamine-phosphate kinase [Pelagicoccus sp. SDUM812002]MDQ8186885.1 thiamine-phosphate kinase [Pelagicoccus sp. SDUM812002]
MNPFTRESSRSIAHLGETQLIENLRRWLGDTAPPPPFGMGDDCAVLPSTAEGSLQLVTADPLIYGKHFDDSITPQQAASKLLRRNLSDIAAMGGRPTHAVISLALDPSVSISWIKEFYIGLAKEAQFFSTRIVGGDISSADKFLGAFLTLYGETLPSNKPLLRHAAQAGSPLYVTGTLGGTRLKKHHTFTPRLIEGHWLANSGLCLSCSDLSDGLGKDFLNVIPTHLACEIDCSLLPVSQDAFETATISNRDALYHVFNDGEDFELIFALNPGVDLTFFASNWGKSIDTPLTHIGYAIDPPAMGLPSLILKNAPQGFTATGYEHLR